jgi:hypothetical protein
MSVDYLWIAITAAIALLVYYHSGPDELTFLLALSALGQIFDKHL